MPWRTLSQRDLDAVVACDTGAVVFGRDDLMAVVVRGKHRTRFLHAITTQKLDQAPPGVVTRNTLCTAKGALQGWWTQVVGDASHTLWTARGQAAQLVDQLLSYRVAERVKLALDDELALVEVVGPDAQRVVSEVLGTPSSSGLEPTPDPAGDKAGDNTGDKASDNAAADATLHPVTWTAQWAGEAPCAVLGWPLRLPQLGRDAGPLTGVVLQLPRASLGALAGALLAAGASAGCHAAREVLRVRAGVPRLRTDLQEGTTPLELGLADAVHLSKGCYLGHEALAMQSWRGQLRRHLCWLAPTDGAAIVGGERLRTAAGKRAGQLGGGVVLPTGERLGLGLIQRRAYGVDTLVTTEQGATLRVCGTTRAEVFSP